MKRVTPPTIQQEWRTVDKGKGPAIVYTPVVQIDLIEQMMKVSVPGVGTRSRFNALQEHDKVEKEEESEDVWSSEEEEAISQNTESDKMEQQVIVAN